MTRRRKILNNAASLILPLCLCAEQISAQTLNDNVIPPSPKSQELMRFGDFPVSLHTGVPNISIPIYTIKLKDYSLPITLDYNASGIKVEQESGETGLGWTLQSGGIISHTIRGYYDFADEYYFTRDGDDMEDLTGIYHLNRDMVGTYWKDMPFLLPSGMSKVEFFRRLSNECLDYGSIDYNPDLFQYNFCGYSGKFIFDHKQNIVKEKHDNVIITPIRNKQKRGVGYLSSWMLTAPDGTKYYFEQTESSINTDICESLGGRYYSGYYLTRIVTPSNSQIQFFYSKHKEMVECYRRILDDRLDHDISFRHSYYENIRLDKITFPNGEIDFNYQSDRQDLSYAQSLSSVSIRQYGSQPVRWDFKYGYFVADRTSNDMPTLDDLGRNGEMTILTDSWNKKRLKLESVVKVAGNQSLPYFFSYNETDLPTKLSVSQDHWGYFNNAPNHNLIPSFRQKVSTEDGDVRVVVFGLHSDREADGRYNQAFLLSGITYPTGGSSIFSYEPNEYRTDNFENDPLKKDLYYRFKEYSIVEDGHAHNIGGDWKDTAHVELIPTEHDYMTRFKVSLDIELDDSYNRAKYENKRMYFRIYGKNSNSYVPWSFTLQDPYTPETVTDGTRNIHKEWSDIKAGRGTYIMEAYGPLRAYVRNMKLTVSRISTPEEYISEHPTGIGGGVRIREIRSCDTDGRMLSGKQYLYTEGGASDHTLTTGKLMEYPRYRHLSGREYAVKADGLRNKGYSVGYSEVSVVDIDGNGQPIGKSTSYFSNQPDHHLCYSEDHHDKDKYPAFSEKDVNTTGVEPYKVPGNGNLLRTDLFRYQNGVYSLLQRSSYKYLAKGEGLNIYWGIRRNVDRYPACTDDAAFIKSMNIVTDQEKRDDIIVGFVYPALVPYTSMLSEERITDYLGSDSIVQDVSYAYNEQCQLTRKTLVCRDTKDVTEYKYPTDMNDDAVMKSLVESNRISVPVCTLHTRGSSMERTEYSYGLFNQVPRLASIMTNTGSGDSMETRSQCLRYDSHGNQLEVMGSDSVHTVYLWGYDYQYPVAEIRNATFLEVCSALGTSPESLESFLSAATLSWTQLHAKLPDAMVTTYSYKPFLGITRVTLPSGETETYEYDPFGRLSCVMNSSGQVIKKYDYHYQKEEQP